MPESKRPLKVFLCHAHADRDPVRGLYARLTKDSVDAWFDKSKFFPGQDWDWKSTRLYANNWRIISQITHVGKHYA